MVATKKSPLQEGNFDVRRGGGSSSSSSGVTENSLNTTGELGGVIFICNNETMDLDRGLFDDSKISEGLPQRYQDLVRAIQPGMPLFLYNYSTKLLYGVYEAASNGALNIEPDAWAESKESVRNGKPVSKYPAQVKMRLRQERPPLSEGTFRPHLRHYEYPKFKLDLTPGEAETLLRLFEENGGGWQTVRGSRPNRGHHVAMNSQTGRRRTTPIANGTGANGSPALMGLGTSAIDGVNRPGSRADTAPRWRTDSDSWSGSSSAGTGSSSWTSQEEERPRKSYVANGVTADAVGIAHGEEKGVEARGRRTELVNGNSEVDRESEGGTSSVEGICSNGVEGNTLSNSAARGSSSKPGFASYSAAVKAGIPTGAIETSGWEPSAGPSTDNHAVHSGSRIDNGKSSSILSPDVSPSETLADKIQKSSSNGSSRSPKGDFQSVWVAYSKPKSENGSRRSEELSTRQQAGSGLADERTSCSDGDSRKSDRAQPWSKPGNVLKSPVCDTANTNGSTGGPVDVERPCNQVPGDNKVSLKPEQNDGEKGVVAAVDVENDAEITHSKGTSRKVKEGKDATGPWRPQDPDSSSCINTVNGVSGSSKETLKHAEANEAETGRERTPDFGSQKQQGHSSELPGQATSLHVSKAQFYTQQNRSGHDSRKSQFEFSKHLEDRPGYYRKQLPLDHSQAPPHSHARQHNHNLPPIRVPTSPPLPMQQQHHHPLIPTTSPAAHIYRERPHVRGVRAGGSFGDGVQVQTYRPVTTRGGFDGHVGLGNPVSPGSVSAGGVPAGPSPVSPSLWESAPIMPPHLGVPAVPYGPVLIPQPLTNAGFENVEILHAEILEYSRSVAATHEARRRAEAAVECVRRGVKQHWRDADVEVFGSFATGLFLVHSDVDVVVLDTPPPRLIFDSDGCVDGARALALLVLELSDALKGCDWCEETTTLTRAAMPVLKLKCLPDGKATDTKPPVAMDISIGGRSRASHIGLEIPAGFTDEVDDIFERARKIHNGLPTREYVIERLKEFPALAPLVCLLKSYLNHLGQNNVYTGGLGSFALTLLLVFYLERAGPWCAMRQEYAEYSVTSGNTSVDTHSAASCDEVDEVDDNTSTSSYSTDTTASSSSNEGTASCGDSVSATSSRAMERHPSGDSLHGSPGEAQFRRAGGSFEELWALMQSVPSPLLGILLLGFLRFVEKTDFSTSRFVLRSSGNPGGVYSTGGTSYHHLWIDDPLRPGANIGGGSFNMLAVQQSLRDMLKILTQLPIPNGTGRVEVETPGRRRPLPLLDQLFVVPEKKPDAAGAQSTVLK